MSSSLLFHIRSEARKKTGYGIQRNILVLYQNELLTEELLTEDMAVLENKERICRGSGPNFWRSIYIRELPLTFNCWGSGPQWRNVKVK